MAVQSESVQELGPDEFRAFMSHWPTGVTVITSRDGGQPVGCTVNAMMSVSLVPPLLVVGLSTGSRTLAAVQATGLFGLNVLSAEQEDLCRQFAHGTAEERFAGLAYDQRYRTPVLSDVVASTVCRVHQAIPCGDHVLIVGEPVWQALEENVSPLVFHQREYHELG
jgi:flavin reductase (DIM6/NTAB) family NADH-FMN oxidoreductase RutF